MKKKKNKTLWIILSVLLLLLAGLVIKQMLTGNKGLKVAIEKVQRKTITEVVNANGKLYPMQEVKISADASGEIIALYVKEGDTVKRGQILARIKPELYVSGVEQAQAAVNISRSNVSTNKADLQRLQVTVSQAEAQFKRSEELYKSGVIAQVEYENAKSALATARASLNAANQGIATAQYNVESSRAGLKQAHENLNKTTIVSPMNGIVSKLNIEKGERVVGTMQMAGTEMMRIADFGGIEAKVKVGENDVLRVSVGDTALVEVDAYNDRKFKGIVKEVGSSTADAALSAATDQSISNYELKIQLISTDYSDLYEKNPLPFRPGMSCTAAIQTETLVNTLCIPIQCITTRENTDSSSVKNNDDYTESVFIVKNGQVKMTTVTSGIQDNKVIEIKKGLSENDEVVVAPYAAIAKLLKNGDKVEVVKKEMLFDSEKEK